MYISAGKKQTVRVRTAEKYKVCLSRVGGRTHSSGRIILTPLYYTGCCFQARIRRVCRNRSL